MEGKERAIVRYYDKWVSILCPMGHVITAVFFDKNFAGSANEVNLSAHGLGKSNPYDRLAAECKGYSHAEGGTL